MQKMERQLVPIAEVRGLLGGIGRTTVYELIKRREIVKVNIGRRGFVTSESLEAYLTRLSAGSQGVAAHSCGQVAEPEAVGEATNPATRSASVSDGANEDGVQ